jgi:hypothetical protein
MGFSLLGPSLSWDHLCNSLHDADQREKQQICLWPAEIDCPHEMRSAIGSSLRPGIISVKTPTVLVWTISPPWCSALTQEATDEAEEVLRQAVEQLDVMPSCRDLSGTRPVRLFYLVVRDGAPENLVPESVANALQETVLCASATCQDLCL